MKPKLIANWSVPPFAWAGKPCFILACGPGLNIIRDLPSLTSFGRVIAINDAYRLCPTADALYFHDDTWWESNGWHVEQQFLGRYIITCNDVTEYVYRLRNSGATGLETDPGALRHGSNSGYQAINLAVLFGAKKIVLIGYDLQTREGRVHWRSRSRDNASVSDRTMKGVMLPKFKTLKTPLEKAGVEVINATPESALAVWRYQSLPELLGTRSAS